LSTIEIYTLSLHDALPIFILAKETGLWNNDEGSVESAINVVPLFETIEDLEECGRLMSEIFENELYQKQLQARDNFQEIMVGYSDRKSTRLNSSHVSISYA